MCRLVGIVLCFAAVACAAPEKKFKDQAEYDLYNAAVKDIAGSSFNKAATNLDTWQRQYPDSDYRDDRQLLYVQTWAGASQPAKAVDAAGQLIDRDLDAAFAGPADVIKLLYTATLAIPQIATPSDRQLEIGRKAAERLLAYPRKPDGITDGAWAEPRKQLQAAARLTLIHIAIVPGAQALQKNDCQTAETVFSRALSDYPDSAQAAWYMGVAGLCLYKTQPEKASAALYELARAAALDPVKGMVDPKWQRSTVDPYLEKIYNQYHGADPEGLQQLKQLAIGSPLPPPGFKIQSLAEILNEKQTQFETKNPQLALWMKIKAALSETKGDEYFIANLKDSAVPQLKGVLVEARPACRPTQLLVAIPLPGAPAAQAEISLQLDKPLPGKPETQTEFQWAGVPAAFAQNPFLLTMEAEASKIDGLKTAPCVVAPRSPAKKKK